MWLRFGLTWRSPWNGNSVPLCHCCSQRIPPALPKRCRHLRRWSQLDRDAGQMGSWKNPCGKTPWGRTLRRGWTSRCWWGSELSTLAQAPPLLALLIVWSEGMATRFWSQSWPRSNMAIPEVFCAEILYLKPTLFWHLALGSTQVIDIRASIVIRRFSVSTSFMSFTWKVTPSLRGLQQCTKQEKIVNHSPITLKREKRKNLIASGGRRE